MKFRARAPLRLGLAGGGTDVSPYSDKFGGLVLNATIDKYAYAIIEPREPGVVIFEALERGEAVELRTEGACPLSGDLLLHKAVYNSVQRKVGTPLGFKLTTFADAPAGSGLGTSSTLVVAMLGCFTEWLNFSVGDYEIAHWAFEIERQDAGLEGGKQDQYAATFGGFNLMEFYEKDRVIVNPLRTKPWIVSELEASMVLYYTGQSRQSHRIIMDQIRNAKQGKKASISAMHQLKRDAVSMKEFLLKGNIPGMAEILRSSWKAKRRTSTAISNESIEAVFEGALDHGALAGKVSGAGGGGFIFFLVDPANRYRLINYLKTLPGSVTNFLFTPQGMESWTIRD